MKKKVIMESTILYEAEDGTSFRSKSACFEYEKVLERKRIKESYRKHLESILIDSEFYPYVEGVTEDHYYNWYNLKTAEDIEAVINVYEDIHITSTGIICVESENEDGSGDNYLVNFNSMTSQIRDLYYILGFDMLIRKREE